MISGINASVSGVNAGRIMQSVAAENIANMNTKDYTPKRVDLSSTGNGVAASISESDQPTLSFTSFDGTTTTVPNVDLLDETVAIKQADVQIEFNVAAIKMQNDSLGKIVDMLG